MVKAFPLNQNEYSYNAQDVMKYFAGRNSGVFETGENLKVSVKSGLQINVNSGVGWLSKDYVASVVFWNEAPINLTVEVGDDTYNRIDLVVVSWNFPNQDKNPEIVIRKGTPSANPAVPSLVNDNSTIEIALAKINVAKGTVSLAESNIVDLRGDSTYCPMVYAEKTIKDTFDGCVGYSDGVNKISDFPNATPASSDKILIEQGGEGKSATIANAVNTCSLSYEEIMATNIDLTGKVSSASALNTLATQIDGIVVKNIIVDANKTLKLNKVKGWQFMGILLTRAYLPNKYSMYYISGYANGIDRYNATLINGPNNPIASIDVSVENTISLTVINQSVHCSFLWFTGGDNFTYEII